MSERPVPLRQAYDAPLRRIERVGFYILFLWLGILVLFSWAKPDPYGLVWRLLILQLLVGRPLAIIYGMAEGMSWAFLWIHSSMVGILLLFFFYPVLVVGYRHAIEFRAESEGMLPRLRGYLNARVTGARRSAESYMHRVEPYGVMGVFIFVFIPVYGTGPLPGSFIGYLLGLPLMPTVLASLAGHLLGTALYMLFFTQAWNLAEMVGVSAGAVIAVLLLGGLTLYGLRLHRTHRAAATEDVAEEVSPAPAAAEDGAGEAPAARQETSDRPVRT